MKNNQKIFQTPFIFNSEQRRISLITVVMTVVMICLISCDKTGVLQIPSSITPVQQQENSYSSAKVRYDGIYQGPKEDRTYEYLRFYEDGTVVSINLQGDEYAAIQMLGREGVPGTGNYLIRNAALTFSISTLGHVVDYEGIIRDNTLILNTYNRTSGHKDLGKVYQFVKNQIAKQIEAEEHHKRGFAYWNEGNIEMAIENYDKAISINPNYPQAYSDRGSAYLSKGNLDQAIRDYDKAISINPNFSDAYNNRGLAYDFKGNSDRAIQDYDKAISINPNYVSPYTNRGNAYYKKGNYDRADMDFKKGCELGDKESCNKRVCLIGYASYSQCYSAGSRGDERECTAMGERIKKSLSADSVRGDIAEALGKLCEFGCKDRIDGKGLPSREEFCMRTNK